MMRNQQTTVVLISHDINLINSVATDVIHFSNRNLNYYRGNYVDFLVAKQQHDLHIKRQQVALDKQRDLMIQSIENMSKKSSGASNSGSKKISKAINSRKKKLERHGIEKDIHGHRLTAQTVGTGIKVGSINSLDATTRKKLSYKQLKGRGDLSIAPVPDKAVQFIFRDTNCTWGEPLISAIDVGHSFQSKSETPSGKCGNDDFSVTRQNNDRMLFDSVDLSVDEKSIVCILGKNCSGKTTLLRILAKQITPMVGEVHHAHNSSICLFDQHMTDEFIRVGITEYGSNASSISLLSQLHPEKSEQDIRGTLTDFGLNPQQASTYIQFLSGGERCRLSLATLMLQNPDVLIMDEPTNHLDPESVEALAYGLKHWNGTVVMSTHDVHFIRMLECTCYVLVEKERKLRRLQGGIDSYLNILLEQSYNHD
jgi:ATPase subunit of ABC transporter with duplicated ATPase domains